MNERHIGLSFGRVEHWRDGLGEFSRQLGTELALRAQALRREHGIVLHYHLPSRWHGQFGRDVHYLPLHTLQRYWHRTSVQFALWHRLHQHIRLLPPTGTLVRVETVHDLNFLHLKAASKRERYRERMARCPAGGRRRDHAARGERHRQPVPATRIAGDRDPQRRH